MSEIHQLHSTFSNLTSTINQFGYDLPKHDFANIPVRTFLKNYSGDQLLQINTSLQSYHECISEELRPNESEGPQTLRHFQNFLDKFSLSINPMLLEDLQDSYIIEVYSRSHQQIYRSVNFFKQCSYDLGALTFIPWNQLFYRSPEDSEEIFKIINVVMDNNLECIRPTVPVHFLTELCSDRKFGYRLIRAGSVFDQETGESMGYLSIISVKEVLDAFRILN